MLVYPAKKEEERKENKIDVSAGKSLAFQSFDSNVSAMFPSLSEMLG